MPAYKCEYIQHIDKLPRSIQSCRFRRIMLSGACINTRSNTAIKCCGRFRTVGTDTYLPPEKLCTIYGTLLNLLTLLVLRCLHKCTYTLQHMIEQLWLIQNCRCRRFTCQRQAVRNVMRIDGCAAKSMTQVYNLCYK